MSILGTHARFHRLLAEHAAWKLLRADNAALTLAFLSELFAEEGEVPWNQARLALDTELIRGREQGYWESETPAGTYINQWIRSGWLREMDDRLTRTDASEVALRFCESLGDRTAGTSASHLRIVQDAVRELAVAINPDAGERIALLEDRKAGIQQEIDALKAGVVHELSEAEQYERIREIYQLASVLTGDFRRIEDEIRQLDKSLRVEIIEGGQTRGEVLLSVMEREALLARTDAGSAFEGFFQLLCDPTRSTEFREQLRSILGRPVAEKLSAPQRRFLNYLMRELSQESERVLRVRRRTEEGLRAYVESGAAQENRAVDRLLGQLEQAALALRDAELPERTPVRLHLPVGIVRVASPDSMKLHYPDTALDTSGVEEQPQTRELSQTMLDSLDSVQVREVALRIHGVLQQHGPMTVSGVVQRSPVQAGLEELVAFLRVARSVGAASLDGREQVELTDRNGLRLSATIPTLLLSAELFPASPDELVL